MNNDLNNISIEDTLPKNPFDDIIGMYIWSDEKYIHIEVTFKR